MKTTERFRPEGDTLVYQVTVEDPEVLVKPWITDAKTLRRVTKPTYMEEAPPCSERDNQHIVGKQREM
jgi:hypothetical protein